MENESTKTTVHLQLWPRLWLQNSIRRKKWIPQTDTNYMKTINC